MSDETRMTLLHSSTNDLVEELLMWRGRAAELLDRIAELENEHAVWLVGATNEIDRLNARIAELEAEIERLTVHSDIERQDDKWTPEVRE